MSAEVLRLAAEEEARNAILLNPKLPAAQIAEFMRKNADPSFLEQHGAAVQLRDFRAVALAVRKRIRKDERRQHLLFPEWDLLPDTIRLKDGSKVPFSDASLSHGRALVASLRAKYKARLASLRKRVDAEKLEKPAALIQAEEWVKTMEKHARKHPGIKAAEVAILEAEREEAREKKASQTRTKNQ